MIRRHLQTFELPDCGNDTVLSCSSCLDDLFYSGQTYYIFFSYYSIII